MAWEIEASEQVEAWLLGLSGRDFAKIAAAIDQLEQDGPALGRPIVGEITGTKHKNLKELRSIGKHMRILFAFDPDRMAILLIGGDKAGSWTAWYKTNVPVAVTLLDRHLAGEQI